jgi:hypothetical protein
VADAVDRLFEDEAVIGPADDFDADRVALSRGERPAPPEPERDLDSLFADPVSGPDRQRQPGVGAGPVTGGDRQLQRGSGAAGAPGVQPVSGVTGTGADPTLSAAEYRGRAIYSGRFDPMAVEVDAARFQYKADGDAEGVDAIESPFAPLAPGESPFERAAAGQQVGVESPLFASDF